MQATLRDSRTIRPTLTLLAVLAMGTWVSRTDAADPPRALCTASVLHPISTRVTALDPIARGAVVRLRVAASSLVGIDRAEIRMTSTGGAVNRGPTDVALGTLAPGRSAQGVFAVEIPSTGGRQYVQFLVSGQGPSGRLTRGACYNLLPDGPAELGRFVVTPQGARVMEFAARRTDR